jgi:hypothetical protein
MLTRTQQLVATFLASLLRRQPCQMPYYCRNTQSWQSALVSWVDFVYKLICCFTLNDLFLRMPWVLNFDIHLWEHTMEESLLRKDGIYLLYSRTCKEEGNCKNS